MKAYLLKCDDELFHLLDAARTHTEETIAGFIRDAIRQKLAKIRNSHQERSNKSPVNARDPLLFFFSDGR